MLIPDFSKYSLLVIGDVMLDRYIWGKVQRISPEAPIPVVQIQDRTARLGGAGNVAANLAGIGCKVVLTGILGKDSTANEVAELLTTHNITNACVYTEAVPTVTKTRVLGESQQIVRLDDEKPDRIDDEIQTSIFNILKQDIIKFDAVVMVDYAKGLFNQKLAQNCITICKENNIPVFIDPKKENWTAYTGATCITPNFKEFESAVRLHHNNPDDQQAGATTLLSSYCLEHLVVTQGSAGMTLFNKNDPPVSAPSQAREVYDVSGAGDTVIALLAAGYAAGLSMVQAMKLANVGAGEVVGRVGTYALTSNDLKTSIMENRQSNYSSCSLVEAQKIVEDWRMLGQSIVFTNGCFDVLHSGHVSLLQRAKNLGNKLVVGLNTDASIKRIKGPSRPILAGEERAAILGALSCVDLVVFFAEDTPVNLIEALLPDVLVKGSDYTENAVVGADLIRKWGGRVELLKLVGENSTTAIVDKIRGLETDTDY